MEVRKTTEIFFSKKDDEKKWPLHVDLSLSKKSIFIYEPKMEDLVLEAHKLRSCKLFIGSVLAML